MPLKYLGLMLLAQCLLIYAAPTTTPPTSKTETVLDRIDQEAQAETEKLLNNLFQTQIDYFSRVKTKLGPQTKRAEDIDAYVARLREAIQVKDIEQKDQMWMNIFQDFSKNPLLLNKQTDTGLTNADYEAILTDSGSQDITKGFLVDLAIYFWKMAKVSGKVVDVAIDEYIDHKRKGMLNKIN